ncbi:flavodoxin family protein [Desulfovermiculus halophilus]|jgi:multimeric flavodoxin WrbA|uniref:flavodoxin family protein n=1 Tax=Desulfovermiculus halophilus TaxID=339722 RepID=UPI000488D19A|nr:flavodoxin family protein [Desulfovermiculus halophilus]
MVEETTVLGICGSPRKKATHRAVQWALEQFETEHGLHTDFFSVRGKSINFCIHCDVCVKKKQGCVHQDDLQELYPLMQKADIWVLGSPVYHGHISAQLKAVLDRTRALLGRDRHMLRNKLGMGIAVGGDRNGGQEQVLHTVIDFCLINEMVPVSGGVFGSNLGGTVWSQDKGGAGMDADQEGLKSIRKSIARAVALHQKLGA